MILKKDNFKMGVILGALAPLLGMCIYKFTKLSIYTWKETYQFLIYQPNKSLLTVSLTLSLMLNAVLFTVYINQRKDYTAKGIFVSTLVYGLIVLSLKTFA
jgi:hypothetical protein